MISFVLIYTVKIVSIRIAQKYPSVNYKTITEAYGSELQYYAFVEY
jgi:hypothetical protein